MELYNLLKAFFIFIFYVQCDEFSDKRIIVFFVNFIPFFVCFLIKYSIFYFKIVSIIFVIFKTLFFVPLLPIFVQYSLTIFVSFDFFWDAYLLLSVYSVIFICLPYYIYNFYFKRHSFNYFYVYQIKISILIIIHLTYSFENSISFIFYLLSCELYKSSSLVW